mmetsp:Transcript_4567/g.6946  ORF Transcript_4567/g.6946 Transcript_4567/m.6946 type:complete len:100 (+) Transcript_4567:683-982(+)
MPRELDTSRLEKFAPKPRRETAATYDDKPAKASSRLAKDTDQPWPSREAPQEGQFTIRAPLDEIARFKKMCQQDRFKYTYAAMLSILMDRFEGGEGGSR